MSDRQINYAIVHPDDKCVARSTHYGTRAQVLHFLGRVYDVHDWESYGFIEVSPDSKRVFQVYANTHAWGTTDINASWMHIYYDKPIRGIGVLMPIDAGDVTPYGTACSDDVGTISNRERLTITTSILWLGHQRSIHAATQKVMQLATVLDQAVVRM